MPSFSLSCFIGVDSLITGPAPKKRRIPLSAEPRDVPRVKCNASIPGLAAQFAVEADGTNELPELMIESDKRQLGNNVTKSLNPYRSDEDLSDLDWRFSADNSRFVMDEEVCYLNSRVVIVDPNNKVKHVLHGSHLELYLANNWSPQSLIQERHRSSQCSNQPR